MGLKPTGGLEPPLLAAIDRLVEICGRHNVVPGCASFGFEAARKLVDKGVVSSPSARTAPSCDAAPTRTAGRLQHFTSSWICLLAERTDSADRSAVHASHRMVAFETEQLQERVRTELPHRRIERKPPILLRKEDRQGVVAEDARTPSIPAPIRPGSVPHPTFHGDHRSSGRLTATVPVAWSSAPAGRLSR